MRKRHLPLRSVRFDEDIEVEDAEMEEERKERELEASIEERRQEILEDLQEDPEAYYRTLEPGWMDELRAWYLFYTRYFNATGYLLYQYLRFYINWTARWLWAVFRSPVGRKIMAVFVALRVAMLCAEVQYPGVPDRTSLRSPCTLSQAKIHTGEPTYRKVSDTFNPFKRHLDDIFATDATAVFLSDEAYKAAKSAPPPPEGTSLTATQAEELDKEADKRRKTAAALKNWLVHYDRQRHAAASAIREDLLSYLAAADELFDDNEDYLSHVMGMYGAMLGKMPQETSEHVHRILRHLSGKTYKNMTAAAIGIATHNLLATLRERVEPLLVTAQQVDEWLFALRLLSPHAVESVPKAQPKAAIKATSKKEKTVTAAETHTVDPNTIVTGPGKIHASTSPWTVSSWSWLPSFKEEDRERHEEAAAQAKEPVADAASSVWHRLRGPLSPPEGLDGLRAKWAQHVKQLRRFVDMGQRGAPGRPPFEDRSRVESEWALYPVQCTYDVTVNVFFVDSVTEVGKLVNGLVETMTAKTLALEKQIPEYVDILEEISIPSLEAYMDGLARRSAWKCWLSYPIPLGQGKRSRTACLAGARVSDGLQVRYRRELWH